LQDWFAIVTLTVLTATTTKEVATMCDEFIQAQLGHKVPDFELDTYDPKIRNFGKFKLSENMAAGKWTILFFYPADFTFV
jgi:peroxiredoxin (alkyl hydroperoxide reductase subunit C)